MVHSITSLTGIVVLSASLAACHQQAGQTEMQKEIQANEQASSARSEAEQHFQNARAAADDQIATARMDFVKARENYLHAKREDLVSLDGRVMRLQSKARSSNAKARAALEPQLSTIQAQRDEFVEQLRALESAAPDVWDVGKDNLDKEWASLKADVDKIND